MTLVSESSATEALSALSAWLESQGVSVSPMNSDDWQVTEFEDALLVSPSGLSRSNRLYLVRGLEVVAFNPSVTSFDDAYRSLG